MAGVDVTPSVGGDLAAYVMALGLLGYAVACAFHVRRAFAARLTDRWSALVTTLALVALASLTAAVGGRVLPAPFGPALLVPMVGGALFTLLFTAFRLQRVVDRFKEALPALAHTPQLDLEGRRKTPHLLMGLGVLLYVGVANLILRGIASLHGFGGTAAPANVLATRDASTVAAGHAVGLWLLFALLFMLLPVELVRLRFPDTDYPWKRIILPRLRRREHGLMGAHVHMLAGLSVAYVALAPDPTQWDTMAYAALAVLAVTVFADTASAIVGRRFGRRKWFHNPNKSYLGSAAGTLVAFAACVPLVGWWGAAACAVAFLVVDIVGPVPIAISDNLLNPFAVGLVLGLAPGLISPMV